MPLTVFCNAGLQADQKQRLSAVLQATGGHHLLYPAEAATSNLVEGPSDPGLLQADAAFGQPKVADLLAAPRLKFVQLSSAGWDRYDTDAVRSALTTRNAVLCTASGVYCEPCAEHVLAFMLASARALPLAAANQATHKAWPVRPLRNASRLLVGQTVLLVGYGTIATRIAELLAPFHMKLKALRRTVRGDERVPTYPIIAADELLPDADHIINILPGGPQTRTFFDHRRLSLLSPTATFYNIGRGSTVDQPALAELLRQRKIAAAYLDVTDPEPLPPTHELWTTPNCHITPHTAGGFSRELDTQVTHFEQNWRAWLVGGPLVDRVI